MTEVVSAPVAPAAPAPVVAPAPVQEMNPSDAARALAARRVELRKQTAEPAAPQEAAPEPPPELADEANAAPHEEAPSEPTEAPEPAELPPIERPRSWSKDDDDDWNALPRARQEKIAANERARESEIRQRINDAAEKLKGVSAKEQEVEKVRQQLEADAKAARDVLEREQRVKFPDIKTWDDYERLSAEASRLSESDPFTSLRIANYLKDFDTHQKTLQFNAQQLKQIEDQKAQERQSKRSTYEAEQNARLIELVPEMADSKKAGELRERAVNMLVEDLGLRTEQLSRWMADDTGHEILSNAGIQKLIADGLKYRDIKSAPKAVPQALPPVQRPGVSKPATNSNAGKIQALEKSLNNASGYNQAKIMAEIRMLRRAR